MGSKRQIRKVTDCNWKCSILYIIPLLPTNHPGWGFYNEMGTGRAQELTTPIRHLKSDEMTRQVCALLCLWLYFMLEARKYWSVSQLWYFLVSRIRWDLKVNRKINISMVLTWTLKKQFCKAIGGSHFCLNPIHRDWEISCTTFEETLVDQIRTHCSEWIGQ